MRRTICLGVAMSMVLAAACGQDGDAGRDAGQGADAPADGSASAEPSDDGSVSGGRLVLITEAELGLNWSQLVPIQVRYQDKDDLPISGALIAFETVGDTADTRLLAATASTDLDGVAEVMVMGGTQSIDFEVRISVADDETVDPVTVTVHVGPDRGGHGEYVIRVIYRGPNTLHHVEVTLYDVDRDCDTLIESATDPPSSDTAWTNLLILPDSEGSIVDRGLYVPGDVVLRYAVARATASDGEGGSTDYFVAFGCQDRIPAQGGEELLLIEIEMHDIEPP